MTAICPLCAEKTADAGVLISHMSRYHNMNFNDKDDMNRRLEAVGLDPVVEVTEQTRSRTLHG